MYAVILLAAAYGQPEPLPPLLEGEQQIVINYVKAGLPGCTVTVLASRARIVTMQETGQAQTSRAHLFRLGYKVQVPSLPMVGELEVVADRVFLYKGKVVASEPVPRKHADITDPWQPFGTVIKQLWP
jgi:hypothetical protein